MERHLALLLASVLTLGATTLPLRAADRDNQLIQQALGLLDKSCAKCHGDQLKKYPGLNVHDASALLNRKGSNGQAFIAPGSPEKSVLFQQVKSGDMPDGGPRFTPAQLSVLERWIRAGALFPAADPRAGRSVVLEQDILQAMRNHLATLPESRRRTQRYFSLANISNDPNVNENTLHLYRAALSKAINSLTWEPKLVVPRAIDRQETVFAVDTTELGWDRRNLWDTVLSKYPYGLTHKFDKDTTLRGLSLIVTKATGTDLPCIRADWFIAKATRPPLYHDLLDLPTDVKDLEKGLNVDLEKAFLNDEEVRAGVIQSGVSKQNRLIERVPTRYGAYWKSYDFKPDSGLTSNLVLFPLGPKFSANPFTNRSFVQAGGEIVFNLPNGLQGYLLVDAKGKRIDKGPSDIVFDPDGTSGTTDIVTGLSCMACHSTGIKEAGDVLRNSKALKGDELAKLRRLHPEPETMKLYFRKDQVRFLKAVSEATSPFLRVGADRTKRFEDFEEPLKVTARKYLDEVSLEMAARELGFQDPQELKRAIATGPNSARLQNLTLGALVEGTPLKRESWEGSIRAQSLFQTAALLLGRGTPVIPN
jgi:phage baseplate assembly protein W